MKTVKLLIPRSRTWIMSHTCIIVCWTKQFIMLAQIQSVGRLHKDMHLERCVLSSVVTIYRIQTAKLRHGMLSNLP